MFYFNTLNLTQISGGNQVKQGDLGSTFTYKLADEKNQELDIFDQKTAYVNLVLNNNIVFTTTVIVDGSMVTFNIDKAIPTGLYFLEIKIDSYIFPSDRQTIILVEAGAVAYDLKDLVPNYDTNMTISGILSDLSQKGIDINDLKTKMSAIYNNALADHAEIIQARGGQSSLDARLDGLDANLQNQINTNKTSIATTGSRIDNLIANAGNGTVPSELIDLRVARSGRQYLTAGEAIRKQFEEVNMNLSELQNNISIKWNNGFVRTDGTINTTNADWKRSDYISIGDYSTVSLTGTFPSLGAGLHIAFFDKNKKFISGITDATNKVIYQYQILSIPANANYMILTTQAKDIGTVSLTGMVKISAIVREFASSRLDAKIIVAKDGTGDYTTLTDAVANAKDGDRIYVKSGNYSTEHVEGWGKSLIIEGENPLTTIISCSDSTYERPAMEFSVGILRNLTIKRAQGSTGGYALHVEDSNLYGKTLTIDNCVLITEGGGSALGMGMYGNCKILLKDSKFITNSGYAALYLHDSNHKETKGIYDVEVNNCYFETNSEHVVKLQSQEMAGSLVNMTWINNTFYTVTKATSIDTVNYYGGLSTNPEDFAGLINWRLRRNSNGNTMSVFNRLTEA